MIATLYGGFPAGLLATVLSAFFSSFFLLEPVGQFHIQDPADWLGLGVFCISSGMITWFIEAMHRSEARANQAESQFKIASERQKAEEALQESKLQFRTLADAIPQLCWMANADGWIFWYNQRWYEYTGTTSEQMAGWGWQSVHDPATLPEVMERWKASIATGEPFDMVFPLRGADGVFRPFLTRVMPVRHQDGKVARWFGTNTDIGEQRKTEEALRESEALLRSFFDSSEVMRGIAEIVDQAVVHVSCNLAAAKMYGADRDSIKGKTAIEAGTPVKIAQKWVGLYEQSRQTGKPVSMEYARPSADGHEYWLLATASYLGTGSSGNPRFAYTILDLTERRRAEQARRASEERLRLFVEHAPAAIAMLNRQMQYIVVSQRWLAAYELAEQDLIGRSHYDVFPELPERWKEIHQRCLAGAVEKCEEDPFPRADGRLDWVRWEIHPWRNEKGEIDGIIVFSELVTERKLAEERLRDAQKLESLGLLAGGVAHDFNNLLVGVIGNASMAQEMLPPGNLAVELLEEVVKSGKQAAHLTRQMLAYAGKGKFVVEPLVLSVLIPEMCGLVQPSIPKKITLSLNLDPDLPAVEADRGQVQQVFMNLTLNAAEAIGSHEGMISVRTCVENVDESYLRLHPEAAALQPGKHVCLEVRDTGCGMDEATKAKVLDPFFTTKFTGRGLGLAAVAGIVRGHKGAILIGSSPGKGTCFTVLFPALRQAVVKESPVAARNEGLSGVGVVLVADDERAVREMAKKALERQGYTVLLADSGLAAIEVFRSHPGKIAVVILDLSMPNMGGEEALPELRKIRPEVRVVVTSGYSESETMTLFQQQQVAGFIQKPYTPRDLATIVKTATG
jgi:two-component system cell cycle sensor histidine kinase/response regulator CckA